MIRPTSIGKIYRPVSVNKPVSAAPFSLAVPQTSAAQPASDCLQISKQGAFQSRLAEASAAMSREASSAVSAQRIADLKQQIENGTYEISAADLADAMLSRLARTGEVRYG